MKRSIDLNCDLGEDPARTFDGRDAALLEVVTSANIACGGHAGDDDTMRAMVRGALARGVRIGAHPGYADRARFGRVEIDVSISDLRSEIEKQIRRLAMIALVEGARVTHLKPHGALYHAAMTRRDAAQAVALATRDAVADEAVVLVGLAGAPALMWWRELGFEVRSEGFADRRYEADGSLRSRTVADAMIPDPVEAAEQAVRLAEAGVRTICIHSDTAGSLKIARAVRRALETAGWHVAAD